MSTGAALLLIIIGGYWLLKYIEADRSSDRDIERPFRAASIKPGRGACPASQALSRERFLTRDIPLVPLENCTSESCTCGYIRHNDRRRWAGERRELYSVNTNLYVLGGESERRAENRCRRSTDRPRYSASDASYADIG